MQIVFTIISKQRKFQNEIFVFSKISGFYGLQNLKPRIYSQKQILILNNNNWGGVLVPGKEKISKLFVCISPDETAVSKLFI